jgi:protein-disulfide isomerase
MKHAFGVAALLLVALWGAAAPAMAQNRSNDLLLRAAASRSKGTEAAPVVVYEIADFQCPFCARFAREIFPQIDSAYVATGKVRWVFVNMPMPGHARAWAAAKAALCAGAVADRFWPVHHRLFAELQEWSRADEIMPHFSRYAREAGVPEDAFRRCMIEDRVAPLIVEDMLNAASAGIRGTPTFFVGEEQRLVGLQPFEVWAEILEKLLAGRP